jgi:hypothetical protein
MISVLRIELPIRTVSVANQRETWHRKHARGKAQKRALSFALNPLGRPELPVTVRLTRIAERRLDDDNLRSAFKAVRDFIAKDWLESDDGDPAKTGITWEYDQEIVSGGRIRVFSRSGKMSRVADARIRVEVVRTEGIRSGHAIALDSGVEDYSAGWRPDR